MEQAPHTVHGFDDDLGKLRSLVRDMAALAERQVASAVDALFERDSELAGSVVAGDAAIDQLEREIETLAIRLLALRQPVASDLRIVVAAMKISHDLERIGDHAANAAKRAIVLRSLPEVGSLNGFQRMSQLVIANLRAAVAALLANDADAAHAVWLADEPIDGIYNGIFREMLTHMIEDVRCVTAATHLLFVAKSLERIGDHATNIAETVHYAVLGVPPGAERPKADTSASTAPEG